MSDTIDYGARMMRATLGVIQDILRDVARDGLPGNHYFYINFDTTHPDVDIPDTLRAQYPSDMTIIIQNWFDNMKVTPKQLEITLSFNNKAEPLVIPWAAITRFIDPSVEFGLQFSIEDDAIAQSDTPASDDEAPTQADAQVVELDKFRKS